MSPSTTNQFKWIWATLQGYRATLLIYFILELINIALSLLFILWSKKSIDIAMQVTVGELNRAIIILILIIFFNLCTSMVAYYINERVRLKLGLNLQNKLIKGQMLSTWKVIKDWHSGDIQVRIHTDTLEVVNMLVNTGLSFLLTGIRLLASFVFLWYMDPRLALIILAISPLMLLSKIFFKKMKSLSDQIKRQESVFGEVLQENLRFRLLIRGMNLFPGRWNKLVDKQQDLYGKKNEQLNFSLFTQGIMKLSLNIGYLTTFSWGLYRLQAGQISFGSMAAFLQLVSRIQTPFVQLISFVPLFIRFKTSLDRVIELALSETEVIQQHRKLRSFHALQLDSISFKYEKDFVLENFSCCFEINKPTAIVGTSGKGKTTLIRILLNLVKTEQGQISFIDKNQSIPLTKEHRINFSYVPQGNTLFAGSIRENLLAANLQAEEQTLFDVLHIACAEFVNDLPNGIDTIVGESGYGLSEGQAQRIAIARAILMDTPIWLFDEITSALDLQTANELIRRLLDAGKDKLIIFVTHDTQVSAQCIQTIYLR